MKSPMARFTLAAALLLPPAVSAGENPADYPTPQAAYEAMRGAIEAPGRDAILDVFGTGAQDILSTGNPQRDADNRADILVLIHQGYRFRDREDGRVNLLLGADGWPFPIPLAKTGGGWAFDIEAGRDEVHFRRIGLNELEAIETLRAYVDVQAEYRQTDHDGDGVMEFAPSLLSSSGSRDGLVWAEEGSPLGVRIALASLDGYNDGVEDQAPQPFGGYYFRILTGQGPAAPGGEMGYVVNGNMVAGHALLAVPADYGHSGIHSFMVSENGVVLEADLGEDSLQAGYGITRFDPGDGWEAAE